MKQTFSYLILILITSCSNNTNRKKNDVSTDSIKTNIHSIIKDSITIVEICYCPSFTNSSTLRLDRKTREVVFTVDTTSRINYGYGRPDTLNFDLGDMESETDIENFWSASFIRSIRQDTSMLGWTDGIPAWVKFTNNGIIDSVYLGNAFTKPVNSLLIRQINYLQTKSTNRAMKAYLKQLKEYL